MSKYHQTSKELFYLSLVLSSITVVPVILICITTAICVMFFQSSFLDFLADNALIFFGLIISGACLAFILNLLLTYFVNASMQKRRGSNECEVLLYKDKFVMKAGGVRNDIPFKIITKTRIRMGVLILWVGVGVPAAIPIYKLNNKDQQKIYDLFG